MNKIIVTLLCIIVVIGAIFTAVMIFQPKEEEKKETVITEVSDENILDECTDEYEEVENKDSLQANSDEEKISPNCSFTQKIYYKKCGHTVQNYLELPKELVNLTKEDLQEKYSEWKIEKFSSNEIVLYKEANGECGDHYLVMENNGKVTIYKVLENGEKELFEKTDISIEYLTESDKINMKDGIRVNSKQELNQLIEDFE